MGVAGEESHCRDRAGDDETVTAIKRNARLLLRSGSTEEGIWKCGNEIMTWGKHA